MANPHFFERFERPSPKDGLSGKYKYSWVEESFDSSGFTDDLPAATHSRNYLGKSIGNSSIKLLTIVLVVGLTLVGARLVQLQLMSGDYYRELAERNRIRQVPIPAERGIIYDRFERQLVQNIPSFTLSIVPQDLPRNAGESLAVVARVAELSGVPEAQIDDLLRRYSTASYQSLVIKENLDYDTALSLYTQNADLPGILIESGTKRFYFNRSAKAAPSSTLSLAHLLGYIGKISDSELAELQAEGYLLADYIGKGGLEKVYEPYLRGTYGTKKIEVDALGREQNVLSVEAPVAGQNLILTIDLEAQTALESFVKEHLAVVKKKRASAIALDPQTGAILAMVSYPSFDNNDFSGGIASTTYQRYIEDPDHPLFNRAVGGLYPSGSIIKLIVAAAALQEKIITPATTVNSVGSIKIGGQLFRDWKAGGHGITTVTKALAWSVNTFFYYIAGGYGDFTGLGVDMLTKYYQSFGLGKVLGIDLPGEESGFVPSKDWKRATQNEPWYVGDTYNLAIGQGNLLVTPLQVAAWTAATVNGGKVFSPYITQAVVDAVGITTALSTRPPLHTIQVNPEHLATVKQGMRDCVTYGSCKLLQSLPFSSGGKTGTAQWRSDRPTHAWFTSVAPLDKPRIVVTVQVEEGGEGATAAMPIARDFLAWWGKHYLTRP